MRASLDIFDATEELFPIVIDDCSGIPSIVFAVINDTMANVPLAVKRWQYHNRICSFEKTDR
jgi:hypothetical protein